MKPWIPMWLSTIIIICALSKKYKPDLHILFKGIYTLYTLSLHVNFSAVCSKIKYIEDITRWCEDMNFIFEWQNNILRTSAASE